MIVDVCDRCDGSGFIEAGCWPCPDCKGTGMIETDPDDYDDVGVFEPYDFAPSTTTGKA